MPKSVNFRRVTLLAFAAYFVLVSGHAMAKCTGGASLKGGYSVTIEGQVVSGGIEGLAGIIDSNGKCGLTGTIAGVVNGKTVTYTLAGSYSFATVTSGTISLSLSGVSAPQTFLIDLASAGADNTGAETDGYASATIELKKQGATLFSVASLKGNYPYICLGYQSQVVQAGVDTFDGAGGYATINYYYSIPPNAGRLIAHTGTGNYTVTAGGLVTVAAHYETPDVWVSVGGIDTKGTSVPFASVSANGVGTFDGIVITNICTDRLQ